MSAEWTEADRMHWQRMRARGAAQSALEQRFANPENPVLTALLESRIRDVNESHRAWVDAVQEAR